MTAPHGNRLTAAPHAAALAAAFLVMAAWTWMTWCDPVVDFGRELYVPWRISCGDALYRDVAYFNGPLSPHLNALWFLIGGASLRTIAIVNLLILAATIALAHAMLRRLTGAGAATPACLGFIGVFAFSQYTRVANFNWVCPYSHELTHGVALSLASLWALDRGGRWRAAAGAALGLTFLTKPEVFVAALGANVVLLAMQRPRLRGWAAWTAAMAAGPVIAWALLTLRLPAGAALRGVLGAWAHLFKAKLSIADPFLASGMGLDAPLWNAGLMLKSAAAVGLLAALLAVVCRRTRPSGYAPIAVTFVAALAAAIALVASPWFDLSQLGRPLPVLLVALLPLAARRPRAQRPLAVAWVVFALLMLLKIGLNVRVYHYGFALALPGTMLLVAALWRWAPDAIDRAGGRGAVFQAAVLAVGLVLVGAHLGVTRSWVNGKTQTVGSGADTFHADFRGGVVQRVVRRLAAQTTPDQTVAAFPEGAMINYLARRRTPTPYVNFIPHEVNLYGEQAMLDAFTVHPPDVVLLVHRDTSSYGHRYFGADYAHELARWIGGSYRPAELFGKPPFRPDTTFGILVMRRRER